MDRIVKVKNTKATGLTIVGTTIAAGTYYTLTESDVRNWETDGPAFSNVGDGSLVVNDGTVDITDVAAGWQWLIGNILPLSGLGKKLAVHSSTKPLPADGAETFSVWTGAGDDMAAATEELSIGNGELLAFTMANDATNGSHTVSKDVKFDSRHGRVWIHEAYLKFENGGTGDYLSSAIIADPSPVQQAANLDLEIDGNNWISYATGGAGTGTHGWNGNPVLIPRPYSQDGAWDWDGTSLTPNATNTGGYKISDIERKIHQYFNKIPLNGSSNTYFTMTSNETAELVVASGYFIRISIRNESNTAWTASILMEIYRERTVSP